MGLWNWDDAGFVAAGGIGVLTQAGEEAEAFADEEGGLDVAGLRGGEVVVCGEDLGDGLGGHEDEAEGEGGPGREEEDDGFGAEEAGGAEDGLGEQG